GVGNGRKKKATKKEDKERRRKKGGANENQKSKFVARMSEATCGDPRRDPGYRFAHPGYSPGLFDIVNQENAGGAVTPAPNPWARARSPRTRIPAPPCSRPGSSRPNLPPPARRAPARPPAGGARRRGRARG